MALLPKRDLLQEALDSSKVLKEHRPYIGMSSLLGKCPRSIWYDFHWSCDNFVSKRTARIFERGNMEEARVVRDLKAAGLKVKYTLEDQIELTDETGHIKGHPDGQASNVPTAPKTVHVLEIKTMKHSLFTAYKKKGLKATNPSYWGQAHTYMGEQGLTRCLFSVTNKDTEERHFERIKFEKSVHEDCMSIALGVLMAEVPPKKIGEITWFECKWCNNKDICHKGAPIKKTCRSCKHSDIEMEGKWSCGLYGHWLNYDEQMAACESYELSEVYP